MLFMQSIRNGENFYSKHDGMSLDKVTTLLTDLGCTAIEQMTEEDWKAALSS
jgi:hypothetical protein